MAMPNLVKDAAYIAYESTLRKEVMAGEIPQHIAIIMDGNRRYAEEILGEPTIKGHTMGREKLKEVLEWCFELGVKHLTLFAFSTENFKRDPEEVGYIMELMEKSFYEYADSEEVHKRRAGIRVIGDRSLFSPELLKAVEYAEDKTKDYDDMTVYMAVGYGGRQDIVNAVRCIVKKVEKGEIALEDIDEDLISSQISTSDIPDPDLVLRTSGEERLSNFLLWQMAYSELYFTDVYWPGFRFIDFLRAVRTYQQRKRRYGA
jgi:tritrans,polycis-undecaprenyl-diphosphate synthase [geranylgeranyl-diphosphate specific]